MSKYPVQHRHLSAGASASGAAITDVALPLDSIRQRVAREHRETRSKNFGSSNPDPSSTGLRSLDRLASAIQPGAQVPNTSAISQAFGKYFKGGNPPIPDTQFAPFKKPFMNGSSNVPISMHKLTGKTRAGSHVNLTLLLKNEAYGQAAYDEGRLQRELPMTSPAWVCKRYAKCEGDRLLAARVDVKCIATLNRVALTHADSNPATRRPPMSYADFCAIWAEFGIVNEAASATTTLHVGGKPCSAISVCLNGVKEIVNLWLTWPQRLQRHDHLCFVFVARSKGYEDIERKFAIAGDPEGFHAHFKAEENKRRIIAPYQRRFIATIEASERAYQAELDSGVERGAPVSRDDAQLRNPALRLSGDPELEHSRVLVQPEPITSAARYARWEPWVTTDGCPPPDSVLHTMDPLTGEVHHGGWRPIGDIMKDHPSFDARIQWENSCKMLTYSDPQLYTEGSSQTNPVFHMHPKVMVNLYTRAYQ